MPFNFQHISKGNLSGIKVDSKTTCANNLLNLTSQLRENYDIVYNLLPMARLNHFVLGILILQIYVYAAPSDVSKIEEIAKVEVAEPNVELVDPYVKQADPKVKEAAPEVEDAGPKVEESDPKLDTKAKEVESDKNSTDTQRQKRWYNPYGFPPMNPLIYPSYNKRDEGQNTGYYGGQDPLVQIHRQIQEIANIVRQPPPPPPPLHHIPIFFPVLFIPRGDCNCNPNPSPTPGPETTESDKNGTTPSIMNRWPVMEDTRQNWGFVVNQSDSDSEDGVEFSRPISFDPIRLNRPMRPQPPVEHGSVQSDSGKREDQPQSEASRPETPALRPPPSTRPPPSNRPQNSSPFDYRPTPLAPPNDSRLNREVDVSRKPKEKTLKFVLNQNGQAKHRKEFKMASYTTLVIVTMVLAQAFCRPEGNKNSNYSTIKPPASLSYNELVYILQARHGKDVPRPKILSPCARAILGCCKDNHINESCSESLNCGAFFFDDNPCDEKFVLDALKAAKSFYQQL
ncbi:unnamed protein product [Spodoptera littoralis]|uniref:Uncharacterized protein n=1 Tax=Spodoptera littoralis TaxID=7109 RepID=A0A9P0IGX3_SPOLI|nr:unnamed protein product [Spodoptera littoralis]CAH1647116.1 unnamed protein product [Spodoptera littoralis]